MIAAKKTSSNTPEAPIRFSARASRDVAQRRFAKLDPFETAADRPNGAARRRAISQTYPFS